MAYDVESNRTILFGGLPIEDPAGEDGTWAYDYNTKSWQEMNPVIEPPSVSRHAMVYSAATDQIILFGGVVDDGVDFTYTNEIWAYDYNANIWTELTPTLTKICLNEGGSGCFLTAHPPKNTHRFSR